jgi:glycosidase
MAKPGYPSLYQINTRIWLGELSRQMGRHADLDDVPDQALDRIAALGFDWIWLLGVWQTGEAGRQVSLTQPGWRQEYQALLPDFRDEDVTGSPFAVQQYVVHGEFGGNAALARFRERLGRRGMRLLLDFVPNHTALDHPWVRTRPEFYIHGDPEHLEREPQNYWLLKRRRGPPIILAHGRDPYFPGWPDTLQLNYRHAGLRKAMIRELGKVAGLCDGVRCDMAMLILPEVFIKTWGDASLPCDGSPPADALFWPEAIGQVRKKWPHFLFLAEVYWDLERTLQQQGFDYTYDKRLYDLLLARDPGAVRSHLRADQEFQNRSARFLENHDEPRAAGVLPWIVHQAAAIVTYLVPGMRFFHEGQLDGRRVKASLHIGRRRAEAPDSMIQAFYGRLLSCLQRPELRDGNWQWLDCSPAWDGNPTWDRFLVFCWQRDNHRLLVTVNYGPTRGQCYVKLPGAGIRGRKLLLRDLMSPAQYERDGDDLAARGLYLDVPEWGYHVFEIL